MLAQENFRKRIVELETQLQHENMKYGSLQREHLALSTEKDKLEKQASTIQVVSEVKATDAAAAKAAAELSEVVKQKDALSAANAAAMKEVSDLLAQLKASDATVATLQQQIKDMQGQLANVGDVAATDRKVAELEAQLASERAGAAAARKLLDEHAAQAAALEVKKQQTIKNVAEVNAYLKQFAADKEFQTNLQGAKVKVALDLWGGSASHAVLTEAQMSEIREDPGVKAVYPRMKEFEAACERANIFFPIEYVRNGRSELDAAALLRIHGAAA